MQIGDYSLGQNICDEPHLAEISQLEYKALPKTFVGEKILRAPDVTFFGHSWNMLLGTINDCIYKLSAQFTSDNGHMADTVYSEAITFCSNQYGSPSLSEGGAVTKWITSFGNVIVDRRSMFDMHSVNFQATSGSLVRESRLLLTRITPLRTVLALLLSAVAAYTFSFAIDLLLGGVFGIYPKTAFLPTFTWSVISGVAFIGALKVASMRGWLPIPFVVFGTLALFGALVGTHPHSFGVAAAMLILSVLIWRFSRRTAQKPV